MNAAAIERGTRDDAAARPETAVRIETVDFRDVPAAAWDDLARLGDNIFFERWAIAAGMALPEARGLRLMLAWNDDGILDAVLPLQSRSAFRLVIATQNWDQRLRSIGGPLVRPGREAAFWQAAFGHFDRANAGMFLRLSTLASDSPATIALIDHLRLGGRPHEITRRYERAILRGGATSAEHLSAHIRSKVLKEHRRLRARLADRGDLAFDRLMTDADPATWIDDLFRLELTGWKGRDGVAAAADPATDAAFRALLGTAHARGRLDFQRMTVGGVAIAMLANIEGPGDSAVQIKIAYDEAWASFSPGVLIEMAYLEYALDHRRLALVDSCARAGHPMIDRIWPDRREIVSLAIPFDRWSSRLAVKVQATARRWRKGSEAT